MKRLSIAVLLGAIALEGSQSWAGASYDACLNKLFDATAEGYSFARSHEVSGVSDGEFWDKAPAHLQKVEEAVKEIALFWALLPEGDKSKNLGGGVGKLIQSLKVCIVDPKRQFEVDGQFMGLHHAVCALCGYAYEASKDQLLLISQQLKDSNKEIVSKDKGTVEKLVERKKSLFFWPKM